MNDPERLAAGHRSELVKAMLSAAREEAPSGRAVERTLSALGAGAAILSTTSAAAGLAAGGGGTAGATTIGAKGVSAVAAKVGSASLFTTAIKWVGVGAVSGLLAAGVVDRVSERHHDQAPATIEAPAAAPVHAVAPAPKHISPRAPEESAVLPEPERRPALPAAPKPNPRAYDQRAPLAAEVLAVDRAREAVAAGQPDRALSEIDAYERRFGERRLAPEALFLRMEALGQRGDPSGARAAARQLLAADPNGPHAARARAVLGAE